MSLHIDAAPRKNHLIIEDKLSKNDLEKIEDNLDIQEKISILFLMTSDSCTFQEIYRLFQKHKEQETYILHIFIDNHEDNWRNKLLEALCIIQNRQVIRELGILYKDLESLYLPQIKRYSKYINPVAKCLYLLCEELTQEKSVSFLQYVKSDFSEYIESLKDTDCLELHILYWIQEKYISINLDGKVNLKKLLRHIKRFNDLIVIYEALEAYENNQNVLDNQNISSSSSSQLKFTTTRNISLFNRTEESVKRLEKGRCIIISQMSFLGKKYETRFGTSADCAKLSETFNGFGFAVDILNNLKKHEILQTLENIPKTFEPNYDCLFLCILSHGYKGGIISSDEQEVSLEEIEQKICCEKLKDVIKIVIIQACQGTVTGQANEALTTDGPTNCNISNILAYRNFCIFMSTIQGFVSVRHKEEGSWFIQELCNVFQTEGSKITFMEAISKIIQRVMDKRGKLNGTNFVAQLPELRMCRLPTIFHLPEYKKRR
ncbi:caspase-8 Dredd [Halictus rubicundus]|uniref:caspase-8 Dredd n=1 Tax=Halictus rubicundus TaxID=77578 RepID=UPI004036B7E2